MPHPAALIAAAYDRAIAAVNTDGVADPAALRFVQQLAARWSRRGPVAPVWPPDAVSIDGRGLVAVRWYTLGGVILGYAVGAHGCYVVSTAEIGAFG